MDAAYCVAPMIGGVAIVLHDLHDWVRRRHRNRTRASRWESGRRGNSDRTNEDRGKNVLHVVASFEPAGLKL
jgi:hypothetical protein